MTDILHLDYAEQCSTVNVTLNNGALASVGQFQGLYQIYDPYNGKPSWTLDPYAIWYSLEYGWLIGDLDNIGQNIAEIYATDDYGGLDDINNQWNYYDGSTWVAASPNDININCTCKNFIYKMVHQHK